MPEANIPAMKRKAAGASSMPPEMARPLVQPPAMPAAYSRIIAPTNQYPALPGLRAEDALPLLIAVGSILLAPFEGAAGSCAEHAAKEYPDQQDDAQVMPGGMT